MQGCIAFLSALLIYKSSKGQAYQLDLPRLDVFLVDLLVD